MMKWWELFCYRERLEKFLEQGELRGNEEEVYKTTNREERVEIIFLPLPKY